MRWRTSISRIFMTSAATAQRRWSITQAALRISPNYADAHYNLALLYQGANQPMKAVRHWTDVSEAGSGQPLGEYRAAGAGQACGEAAVVPGARAWSSASAVRLEDLHGWIE